MSNEIDKILERLGNESTDKGNEVVSSRIAKSGNAAILREREALTDELIKAIHGRPIGRQFHRIPEGYEKSAFNGFGDFLQRGMRQERSGFESLYAPAMKSYINSLNSMRKGVGDAITTANFESAGVLVLPEFAPQITGMIYNQQSLWSRVQSYTVAGNRMVFPRLDDTNTSNTRRHGGARAYRTAEGDLLTSGQLKFKQTIVDVEKLSVALYVTDEMIEDAAYAIEAYANEVVTGELAYSIDEELVVGTGVGQCLGLRNSGHRVTVAKESGQAADTVVSQNIIKMWARRMFRGFGDAWVWLVNPDVEEQLAQMFLSTGSSSGQLTYLPPGGLADRPYATLQGAPVIPCEHCPALGDEGDIILWNPASYIGATKGSATQAVDGSIEFLRDMKVMKFTWRINGRPLYDEPFTIKNSPNRRSTIITLQDRA